MIRATRCDVMFYICHTFDNQTITDTMKQAQCTHVCVFRKRSKIMLPKLFPTSNIIH